MPVLQRKRSKKQDGLRQWMSISILYTFARKVVCDPDIYEHVCFHRWHWLLTFQPQLHPSCKSGEIPTSVCKISFRTQLKKLLFIWHIVYRQLHFSLPDSAFVAFFRGSCTLQIALIIIIIIIIIIILSSQTFSTQSRTQKTDSRKTECLRWLTAGKGITILDPDQPSHT